MVRRAGLHREKGQALILVALSLVGLIAMLALILDGGNLFVQRRRMQNAADAGAIAGTRELALASSDDQIYARVKEYTVIRNGAEDFEAVYLPGGQRVGAGVVPPDATGIQVAATTHFPTYFAGVVGITAMSAGAAAEGGYSAVKATWGLWPIALKDFDFAYHNVYAFWYTDKIEADPNSGVIVGGNRGWLNFNGHDVSRFVKAGEWGGTEDDGVRVVRINR